MVSGDFGELFAAALRHQRKAKKLTQEQLAERAELSSKMISLVERGERIPSLTVADSIARGLGLPLWRLIRDTEAKRGDKSA